MFDELDWPTDLAGYDKYLQGFLRWIPQQYDADAWKQPAPMDRFAKEISVRLGHFFSLIDQNVDDDDSVIAESIGAVAEWLTDYTREWGKFLDPPDSFDEDILDSLLRDAPEYTIEESPVNGRPNMPSGSVTFNQFFAPEFNAGLRPIAEPTSNLVLTSPADCSFQHPAPLRHRNFVADDDVAGSDAFVLELPDDGLADVIGADHAGEVHRSPGAARSTRPARQQCQSFRLLRRYANDVARVVDHHRGGGRDRLRCPAADPGPPPQGRRDRRPGPLAAYRPAEGGSVSRLMRTSEIAKRPVVTMAGEDVAQIKDIVYAAGGGGVGGFTLAGRGLLSGPLRQALAWGSVAALGADAVMIADENALESTDAVLDASASSGGPGGNILGSRVLTDTGTDLGSVVDVVIEVDGATAQCDVVGYEIEASEALGTKGIKLLIPLPDTLTASGEHLIVPASAKDFVGHDLVGFGASVQAFRAQLEGTS